MGIVGCQSGSAHVPPDGVGGGGSQHDGGRRGGGPWDERDAMWWCCGSMQGRRWAEGACVLGREWHWISNDTRDMSSSKQDSLARIKSSRRSPPHRHHGGGLLLRSNLILVMVVVVAAPWLPAVVVCEGGWVQPSIKSDLIGRDRQHRLVLPRLVAAQARWPATACRRALLLACFLRACLPASSVCFRGHPTSPNQSSPTPFGTPNRPYRRPRSAGRGRRRGVESRAGC